MGCPPSKQGSLLLLERLWPYDIRIQALKEMGEPHLMPSEMFALTWRGKCDVAFERVPTPRIECHTDAIVRIELCGLCGSDLHPYHCRETGLDVGTVMGHEFVGTIVQTGRVPVNAF
jgi:hypothetical protein